MAAPLTTSIITPSFNQAAYLEQTILSILNQDIPSLQYIIIDGNSTDGSQEIIRKYEKRLAYWVSEPDRGQADAINKGLARAEGEIVAWLNSDDYYLPGCLATVLAAFAQNPDAGLIFGDVLSVDADSRPINLMRYDNWDLSDLMRFRIIGQPGVFFRQSVMKKAGLLDTSYHYLLDHQYWLRVAQIASIQHLPKTLAAARFHSAAKNVAMAAEFGKEAFRLVEWMQSDTDFSEHYRRYQRKIKAGAYWINARYLSESGEAKKAVASYLRSFFHHPQPVLEDWRRFVYTLLSLVGLGKLQPLAYKLRDTRRKRRLSEGQMGMHHES